MHSLEIVAIAQVI